MTDERGDVTGEHRDEGGGPDQPLASDLAALPDETGRGADALGADDAEEADAAADEPVAGEPAADEPAADEPAADEPAADDDFATAAARTLFDDLAATDEPQPSGAAGELARAEADEPVASDALTVPDEPGPDEPAVSDGAVLERPVPDEPGPDETAAAEEPLASDESATGDEAGLAGEPPPPDEAETEDPAAPWTLVPVMGGDAPAASPETPAAAGRQHDAAREGMLVADAEGVRSIDGELARLHLRTGMLALARAELETMAGWSALDREALIDLAEVRWRTGDLVGAGEAAAAYLEVGDDEPIAFCVAAEAALAGGRRADAEAYAARALDLAANRLDDLFAGQPRSNLWPAPLARTTPSAAGTPTAAPLPASWLVAPAADEETISTPGAGSPATTQEGRAAVGGVEPSEAAASEATTTAAGPPAGVPSGPLATGMPASAPGMRPAAGASPPPGLPPPAGVRSAAGGWPPAGVAPTAAPAAGPPASDELAEAERRLASGELLGFALRLQVVLRLQPALAPAVLALADAALQAHAPSADEAAAIHLVRSDACRLVGREVLSGAAMQEARRLLHATTAAEDSP